MPDSTVLPGSLCWCDLMTQEPRAAGEFYSGLCGWRVSRAQEELGEYFVARVGDVSVAGIGALPEGVDATPRWSAFVASDDADADVAAAIAAGGKALVPPSRLATAEGSLGRFAVVADPTGVPVGIWEAGALEGWPGVRGAPGSVVWADIRSGDPRMTRKFFTDVWGWQWEAMDAGFEYWVARVQAAPVAGLMPRSDDAGEFGDTEWMVYLGVADTDDAVRVASATGGTVSGAAHDSPYGRVAVMRDPQGAAFSVMSIG